MTFYFRLSAILALLTLFACSDSTPSQPACRQSTQLSTETAQPQNNTVNSNAAACLVKIQNKVLLIRHRLTGKLDFPGGGVDKDESLSCAAHRETWEETGFNVFVRKHLLTTRRGLSVFACDLDAGVGAFPDNFSPPAWAKIEVTAVEKIDPFVIEHNAMRFPDDLVSLRDGFIAFTPQ
ncbi:NUDIX domain-containing protein [Alteromonas hispanica]|uniref:NUDIX domain-containing protein n=1 Tax=Alteromonas hispanica TaxID=315421 RepID=A0A6L9MV42_9ALTE|nr:NUDIX hydrolase [Alteromonas hispanica]NDW21855.1 NUDIX domain-containing protein [Alteromonas hispanica]